MTEGWVLAIFIVLLGLLVLVGITNNASISHDDKRRHRRWNGRQRGR
jgi:uncharacterized BrkB/YihY/UPF0761 family membrane protein